MFVWICEVEVIMEEVNVVFDVVVYLEVVVMVIFVFISFYVDGYFKFR